MEIKLALMTGIDIPMQECQLILHQPTIKEVSYLGDIPFLTGVQTLTLYKSMFVKDKDVLDAFSNFQIFMTIMNEPETKEKKKITLEVLKILFPNYKVMMTPQSLLFQQSGSNEMIIIDDTNFDAFQFYLRAIFNTEKSSQDSQSFNPGNEKAREIAEKLMRGRQRVAAQKNEGTGSIFGQYISILSIGLRIPVTDLINYTVYQIYDTLERFSLWMNWDLDIRSRLAGGKPENQPDNWMKNIH